MIRTIADNNPSTLAVSTESKELQWHPPEEVKKSSSGFHSVISNSFVFILIAKDPQLQSHPTMVLTREYRIAMPITVEEVSPALLLSYLWCDKLSGSFIAVPYWTAVHDSPTQLGAVGGRWRSGGGREQGDRGSCAWQRTTHREADPSVQVTRLKSIVNFLN